MDTYGYTIIIKENNKRPVIAKIHTKVEGVELTVHTIRGIYIEDVHKEAQSWISMRMAERILGNA